jgi:hypothetical protein
VRGWVALSNEDADVFGDVETDLLHIFYLIFGLQKVKVPITDKLTSEETDVDML